MKKTFAISCAWAMGVIVLATLIPAGCDSGTGDNSELDNFFASHPYVSDPRTGIRSTVSISPPSATVNAVGGKAVFSLIGGNEPVSWSVSNTGMGTISGGGASATYTATVVGKNDVIAYDRDGNAAIAQVSGSVSLPGISASPSTLSTNGALAVLSVSGGSAPYTWSVTSGTQGAIQGPTTGLTVVYERYLPGDNAVTVVDGLGSRSSLVLKQP